MMAGSSWHIACMQVVSFLSIIYYILSIIYTYIYRIDIFDATVLAHQPLHNSVPWKKTHSTIITWITHDLQELSWSIAQCSMPFSVFWSCHFVKTLYKKHGKNVAEVVLFLDWPFDFHHDVPSETNITSVCMFTEISYSRLNCVRKNCHPAQAWLRSLGPE